MKLVRTRFGHAATRAAAVLAAAAVVSFQATAFPIITNVVETGGDNEATDTIVAQWTGVTWNTTMDNEPIPNTPAGTPFTVPTFGEDVPAMVDRAHQYNGATVDLPIPNYLLGGEYVMIGNDNRDNGAFQLDLYLAERAVVFLLVDWRGGDVAQGGAASNTDPPYLGAALSDWAAMNWVHTVGFQPVNTGWNRFGDSNWPDEIGYDEVGTAGVGPGQEIQQYGAVYYKVVDPGAEGTPAASVYAPSLSGLDMYGVVVTPVTPSTPTDLSTISLSEQVALSWSESSFAASYNIKRSDTPGGPYTSVGSSVTTSFTDSGLVNFQDYYYVVSAVGLGGESSDSVEVVGTPKAAPENLIAQGGVKQVSLSWTALADAASYTVKRADVSGGPYTDIATGLTETSYVDSGLPDGQGFYYTVSAVLTGGDDSANAEEAFAGTAPNVPANFVAERFAATVIRVRWTVADQLPTTTTTVLEESSDGITFVELATVTEGGQGYYDANLAPSITKYYRARATNDSGSSDYTAVASATTPATGINVNFADTAITTVADYPIPGYLDDFGLVFGDRGNGYNYGWDADNSGNDRLRNAAHSPDRRYDTLNHLQKTTPGRIWDIDVPNGLYLVHIVGGDATATDSVFQWDVEGYISGTSTPAALDNWREYDLTVPVNDGRLTITSGPSASNNKICFVDIYPTEPSANEFVTQPASQTVNQNRSVTFFVEVTGPEPYTLQWRFNGNPIENATSTAYTIERAQLSDAGVYSVEVNNAGNVPAVSGDATLTVVELPTLWDIVSTEPDFTTLKDALEAAQLESVLQGEDFLTVFAPDNAAFEALPEGALDALVANPELLTAVLTYHALAGEKTAADLVEGDYPTLLSGASVTVTIPEPGVVKVNDATVTAPDVLAANGVAHVIDQVLLPPPAIITQPEATVAAYVGDTVTLTVAAFGLEPLAYQWTKDGVDIDGATSATLTLTDAKESDSGTYAVKVTNVGGTVTSADSVVTVTVRPPPTLWEIVSTSEDFSTLETAVLAADLESVLQGTDPLTVFAPDNAAFAALPAGTLDALLANSDLLTAVLTYHALAGTKLAADLVPGDYTTLNGADVTVTTPEPGVVKVNDATVTTADVVALNGVAHVIDQVLLPPPAIITQPEATVAAYVGDTVTLSVVVLGVEPSTYQWTKGGVDLEGATSATLTLADARESDSGTYAVRVTNAGGTVTSTDSVVTVTIPPTLWEIVSTSEDFETLEAAVLAADLESVLQGTDLLTVFAPDDDAFAALPAGALDALLANPDQLTAVLTYHVLAGTTFSADLVAGDYPTLLSGASVTVTTPEGVVKVNDATVTTADVRALNGVAHVINQVLVPQAPAITSQPFPSVVATVGDSVTLAVVATGTPPLSYQWTQDGVDLEGATGASLVLDNVELTDAGSYAVRISNAVDTVTSSDSVVSVYEVVPGRPQIVFVSFHPDENTPSANAAAAGFTQAVDVGYTALLKANGYPVTRVLSSGTPDAGLLNAAGLVIISRSVPSADYQDAVETAAWNGITAPTLLLNGYILRSTRLGFTTGTTMVDTTNTVTLKVNDPTHPVFADIELDANNLMVNAYADCVSFNDLLQRGVSVNMDPLAGGGAILATIGTELDPTFGGTVIAEWPAGAVVGSGRDTLGGPRFLLLTGSREPDGAAGDRAGIFDLAADGIQLFLNAVAYMTRTELDAPVIADGKITISWTGPGELETAIDINGPWTPVVTTGGTFTEPIGTGNKFYRVNRTP